MASLASQTRAILTCLVYILFAQLIHCQCNTDQNPYCAGNNQFEQLCCTYPNICYWSNRDGTPACCQAGTDCSSNGGPSAGVLAFSPVQQTTSQTTYLIQTVYTTTQPQYSTVTYYSSSDWQSWQYTTTTYTPAPIGPSFSTVVTPAVVIVTATSAVVAPVTDGAFVTVTQVQAVGNRASRVGSEDWRSLKIFGVFAVVCGTILLV